MRLRCAQTASMQYSGKQGSAATGKLMGLAEDASWPRVCMRQTAATATNQRHSTHLQDVVLSSRCFLKDSLHARLQLDGSLSARRQPLEPSGAAVHPGIMPAELPLTAPSPLSPGGRRWQQVV